MNKLEAALGLGLAVGCAHMPVKEKPAAAPIARLSTSPASRARPVSPALPESPASPVQYPASQPLQREAAEAASFRPAAARVVEEVAQRIKRCGNFPTIGVGRGMDLAVSYMGEVGKAPNTDVMVAWDVPNDPDTIQCIVDASIDRTLPKACMPMPHFPGIGDPHKLTISIDCRDRRELKRMMRQQGDEANE